MEKRVMLRGILILSILLLLLPIASAKITILNNFQDMYNLGDTVVVSGYIIATTTADAQASLELQCPGYTKVNAVNLRINKGQKVTFSKLGISTFLLPSDIEGTCDVEAKFNGESANSDSFTVLNDLLGSFDVSEDKYQLGDALSVSGIVFKLDGSDVTGTAIIYLKKAGSYAVQLDTSSVSNGQLSYSKQLSNLEYGSYYLDIKVADDLGNSQYFENVDSFTINTEVTVRASTSRYQYEPGEEVVITGEIDNSGNAGNAGSLEVTITFDSLRYTTTPTGNSFEYRFFVPKNMKSGDYELGVSVKDSYGNAGTDSFILTVKQIPTKIVNELEETDYKPGETLSMEVKLYDQSDKAMNADVNLQIIDPSGKTLYNGIVNTGQNVELEFGKYSAPGTYTITSTYTAKNLQDADKITVKEVSDMSSSLEGETITVRNDGNIAYDDRVDLILVSEQDGKKIYYVLAKDVALDPGKETSFDLSYEVPQGKYTVVVDDGTQDVSQLNDEALAAYADQLAATTDDVYANVDFGEDNRPLSKKVDQGLSSVTGASTISTYDTNITPWFLVLIVFIFGGLLGLYGYQHRAVIQQAYENYKKKKLQEREDSEGFLSTMEHKGSYGTISAANEDGDIATEEVEKIIAGNTVKKAVDNATTETEVSQKPAGMNIGTFENQRTANMKIQGIKSGTTAFVFDTNTRQTAVKTQPLKGASSFSIMGKPATIASVPKKAAPLQPQYDPVTGKKINRFSTWNPPDNGSLLDDKSFPAKNPVKEPSALEKDKEKALYEDIDEDFLRDEKF